MAPRNDSFKFGSIVRIKLIDFVTYDDVEFRPGPHLNVVIGPNGTGKSSLVCAICLGLSGPPALLGRGSKVSDYVKHKKDKAIIEIELKGNKRNTIVQRTIYTDDRSDWKLNGKTASKKEVKTAVTSYNIQLDNLCQFLPQDKVTNFAKSSATDLLHLTQDMVGTEDMLEAYRELVELQKEERSNKHGDNTMQTKLQKLKEQNELLKPEVDRYRERDAMKKDLDLVRLKHAWLEYEAMRDQYMAEKAELKSVAEQLKQQQRFNKPMEEKMKVLRETSDLLENAAKEKSAKSKATYTKCKEIEKQVTKMDDEFEQAYDHHQVATTKEQGRKKEQANVENEVKAIQMAIEKSETNADEHAQIKEEISKHNEARRGIRHKLVEVEAELTDIHQQQTDTKHNLEEATRQLAKLSSKEKKILDYLRSKNQQEDVAAVEWLRNNKHLFQEQVFEPILTQINCKDDYTRTVIENTMNWKVARSFVVMNKEDQELLAKLVVDKLRLKINIIRAPGPEWRGRETEKIEDLKAAGFTDVLSNMYTCPAPIARVLCNKLFHHDIPIGPASLAGPDKIDHLLKQIKTKKFFSGNQQVSRQQSRYGDKGDLVTTNGLQYGKNLLMQQDGGSDDHIEQIRMNIAEAQRTTAQLAEKESEKHAQQKELNQKDSIRSQSISALKNKLHEHQKRKAMLNTKTAHLRQIISRGEDYRKAIDQAQKKMQQVNNRRAMKVLELNKVVTECVSIYHQSTQTTLLVAQIKVKRDLFAGKMRETNQLLHQLEERFKVCKTKVDDLKAKTRSLLQKAKALGNGDNDELRELLDAYPDDLHELQELMHELQANLDSTLHVNENSVREYEEREAEIEALEVQLTSLTEQRGKFREHKEEKEGAWLTPLNEIIQTINTKFSGFFEQLGCAGEVVLDDSPDDYSNYGVEIRVKFREKDTLHKLTAHHQSGGERSVSTILYLMSFQQMANAPFRIVDEINQGMDPNNERAVFGTIADEATSEGSSQYFLITPKLLADLKYNRRITVLCVFNGEYVNTPHEEWNIGTFIQRRRQLKAAA